MHRRTFVGALGASLLATLDPAWAQGHPSALVLEADGWLSDPPAPGTLA